MKITNKFKISCLFIILSFVFLLSACTTEMVDFSKTCSVKGKVIACDEFGIENQDDSNMLVTLENTSFSTTTDESGSFVLDNVPNGIYNLALEKESYGTRIIRDINVYAYNDTITLKPVEVVQVSTIEITNFSLEEEGYFLYARGTIVHKFPVVAEGMAKVPRIMIYFNNNSSVSDQNSVHGGFYHDVICPSGSEFRVRVHHMISVPYYVGETYCYVAYGVSSPGNWYTNFKWDAKTVSGISRSPLLGKPSNIFSLTKNK